MKIAIIDYYQSGKSSTVHRVNGVHFKASGTAQGYN